jgi:hypothetical protein
MTHTEFVAACRTGTLPLQIDRTLAARYVSARLLLPLVRLPLLGAGVAMAMLGWLAGGLAALALAAALPWLVARAAPRMVLDEALENETRFQEFLDSGILNTVQ